MAEVRSMTDNLRERLRDIYANDDHARGCEGRTYSCSCGFDDRTFQTAEEAESENTRLQEALAAAEAERDEARGWAKEWHRVCQTIATIMELPEPEANFAEVVRAAIPALLAETRKKALEEAAQVAEMRHWTWKQDIAAAIRSLSNEEAPK